MKDEGQMEMTTGRMGKMSGHKKEWGRRDRDEG